MYLISLLDNIRPTSHNHFKNALTYKPLNLSHTTKYLQILLKNSVSNLN